MRVNMLCVGVYREQHLKALFVEKLIRKLPSDFVRKLICKAVVVVRVKRNRQFVRKYRVGLFM